MPDPKQRKSSNQDIIDGNLERPISRVYPVLDTDLARDNVENDLSDADLQDLENITEPLIPHSGKP